MLQCIPELPKNNRPLFVIAVELPLIAATIGVGALIPTIECGTFLLLNCYNLIYTSSSGISRHTVKMQHRLVLALIIQVKFSWNLFQMVLSLFSHP